jgi:hypothetical protein
VGDQRFLRFSERFYGYAQDYRYYESAYEMRTMLFLFVAATRLVVSPFAQTNTLIVPREAATGSGGSFANALTGLDAQQVYSAAEFSEAPADILLLTGVSFCINDNGGSLNAVIPRLVLQMNTFRGSMTEARRDWVGNFSGAITVFDRQDVSLRSDAAAPGTPGRFDVNFLFDRPFLYNRTEGQLVLNIDGANPVMEPADVNSMDAHGFFPLLERGIYFQIESQQTLTLSAIIDSEFSFVPVPEPSTWMIVSVGWFCLLAHSTKQQSYL